MVLVRAQSYYCMVALKVCPCVRHMSFRMKWGIFLTYITLIMEHSMVTMKMTMTLIAAQNCQITSSWPKGIYIVRAIVDKEILSEKITIQ